MENLPPSPFLAEPDARFHLDETAFMAAIDEAPAFLRRSLAGISRGRADHARARRTVGVLMAKPIDMTKACANCGKPFWRRVTIKSGLETPNRFKARRFCTVQCAAIKTAQERRVFLG